MTATEFATEVLRLALGMSNSGQRARLIELVGRTYSIFYAPRDFTSLDGPGHEQTRVGLAMAVTEAVNGRLVFGKAEGTPWSAMMEYGGRTKYATADTPDAAAFIVVLYALSRAATKKE